MVQLDRVGRHRFSLRMAVEHLCQMNRDKFFILLLFTMLPGENIRSFLWKSIPFLAMAVFFIRCAHPVMPTGGEKDVIPPGFVEALPPNYSTHFNQTRIEIYFDEFIQLKEPGKEIFTSPPMVDKPEFLVKGKKLVVELKEDLRENMTYVINFGSAITDITEGNPTTGFVYVFSTGARIDSLSITGDVEDAFDLTPQDNVLVSVYNAGQDTIPLDSMPLKIPPLSATRSYSDGSFQLTNLPGGKYLLFALVDLNNNFYYDLPGEKIGFLDSLITPEYLKQEVDTLVREDSLETSPQPTAKNANPVTIYLFEEVDSTQRLMSSSFEQDGSMVFIFKRPVKDLTITPLNFPSVPGWKIEEDNRSMDTLKLWPTEPERDTFALLVREGKRIQDTITLVRRKKEQGGLFRRKGNTQTELQVRLNTISGILDPGKDLIMTFAEPLRSYDFSGIRLFMPEDTISPPVHFTDSIRRRIVIQNDWLEDKSYQLFVPDSSFTGLSGAANDSILVVIRTKPVTDYGSLIMTYKIPDGNPTCIIELANDRSAIVQRDIVESSKKITYLYLKPGAYKIKVIFDSNGNGKWDAGNFRLGLLSERVIFYGKEITVRSNWEIQEEWQIGL